MTQPPSAPHERVLRENDVSVVGLYNPNGITRLADITEDWEGLWSFVRQYGPIHPKQLSLLADMKENVNGRYEVLKYQDGLPTYAEECVKSKKF